MSAGYAEALGRLSGMVDAKTGIIRDVQMLSLSEADPWIFMAYAEPSSTVPLTGVAAANRGAACSDVKERAIVRACGEAVERYCSAVFELDAMRLASEDELRAAGQRFVSPTEVYPFLPSQYDADDFPYQSPKGRALRWVSGRAIHGEGQVWLPSGCVFVPYLFQEGIEPFTHMPISTGLAAGPDPALCIEKGLLEILERDALMIVWHARLSTPRLDPESCRGVSHHVDRLLDAPRYGRGRWHLNVLTLDVNVPVVSAALIDEADPPLTSFGIAANQDPATALRLALEEALLTRVLVNRSEIPESTSDFSSVRTLRDHLYAHAGSSMLRENMRFLTDDGPLVSFTDWRARGTFPSASEALLAAGYEAYWTDVTPLDVAEHGLYTIRTIVPGMQPLDNDHRHRFLGGRRLLEVPAAMGRPVVQADLNPDPHPFP